MKDKVVKLSRRKHTIKQRIIFLTPLFIIFVFIIPYTLFLLSKLIDDFLHFSYFPYSFLTLVFGSLLGICGLLFGLWSVIIQFTEGKGTPAPIMATQKLVTNGPYSYCRNPMAFGTFIYYVGIGIIIGSFSFVMLVSLLVMVLLVYIKKVEEKELEERFRDEYIKYKKSTPFFIPRIFRKRKQQK